ncbi:MAG: nucleotidyltransferase family protein [Pyrinomonadaceae bacterium]
MTADKDAKIGGLLLAAGGSSRLGRPKQLVRHRGKALIRHAADALVDAGCSPVGVVLGCEIKGSTAELSGLAVDIFVNEEWESGMSSSIVRGVRELLLIEPMLDAVLITLCDQPEITHEHLRRFLVLFRDSGAGIIACEHRDIKGVPALFSRDHFDELLSLRGDIGARDLIRRQSKVATIPTDAAFPDIDTPEDLAKLASD